jgi:hypothetical protein
MKVRGRGTRVQLQETLARGACRGCGIQLKESGTMSTIDVFSGDIKPSKEGSTLGNAIEFAKLGTVVTLLHAVIRDNRVTTKYVKVLGVAWHVMPYLVRRHINGRMICETVEIDRVLRGIVPLILGTCCIDKAASGALSNGAIGTFNLVIQVRCVSTSILKSHAFFIADVLEKGGGLVKSSILGNTYSRLFVGSAWRSIDNKLPSCTLPLIRCFILMVDA